MQCPPTRPVKFLVPWAAGGATDLLSRMYCERTSAVTGQQFVVENRTGAGGTIAIAGLAKSMPDGYTLGLTNIATNVNAKALMASLPYDPANDFTFVSGLWQLPNLLVVNPKFPAKTVPELVELCKRSPGKYTFASAGIGSTTHIAPEMFRLMAGLDIRHVPYRGGAPATLDLLAGNVDIYFDNISGSVNAVKEGKLRGLAVTTQKRSPALAGIAAMAEFLPGYDVTSWTSVGGPAGLPQAVVQKLSEATRTVLRDADLERRHTELGATPFPTTPAEITAYRAQEEARRLPAFKQIGIKPE